MQKDNSPLDGVQISGSKKTGKEELSKKGKLSEEPRTTQRWKETNNNNSTIGRDKKNPFPEQIPQEKEPEDKIIGNNEDLHQFKTDQEGTATGARKQEKQGHFKPKTT